MLQAALVGAGIVVLALAAVAATVRRRLTVVLVDGESMSPALSSGDQVLVARSSRSTRISVGDVVVFRYASGPEEKLIKRVAAVPGDLVPRNVLGAVDAQPGTRVPQGFLVVIGDGVQSTDSRDFGYLAADQVTGVVLRRLSGSGRRVSIPARADARADTRPAARPAHGVAPSGSRPDAAP
ncbi:signal peptidase I [Actinospica robiniae]|uniref:Signal peptidase I n=1 Tax=Actinospica robiniae DSM 44927 TaxID=479430 RepID=W9DZQ0_9ACTN|nr:signal peptidase I [Actinospica robiniae]ETA71070.1 signal peptidase I [Actinospica robiniae DSM 44927]